MAQQTMQSAITTQTPDQPVTQTALTAEMNTKYNHHHKKFVKGRR
jgi:hypothetical protein